MFKHLSHTKIAYYFPYIILTFAWLIIVLIINPIGDFPLNDDWATGRMVKELLNSGKLVYPDWLAMTAIAQVILGYLVSLPFGFSFNILRFLTLLLGFIAIIITYKTLYRLTDCQNVSLIGAFLLMINPIFLTLSNSFMTEIPFMTFMGLSTFYYVRYFDDNRTKFIILAILFSLMATLIRQVGIILPFAFGVTGVYFNRFKYKKGLICLVPFILSLGTLGLFNYWLANTHGKSPFYFQTFDKIKFNFLWSNIPIIELLLDNLAIMLVYLGLFILPLIILFWGTIKNYIFEYYKSFLIVIVIFIWWLLHSKIFWLDMKMPLTSNIITKFGIGPLTLRDIEILNLNNISPLSNIFLWIISTIGIIGGIFLIFILVVRFKKYHLIEPKYDINLIFLFLFTLFYTTLLMISGFFDRYFLPLVPPLIFILVLTLYSKVEKKFFLLTSVLILFYGFYSIKETYNYLSWNRCRWDAINYMTVNINVSPEEIDGGFEFNGLKLYNNSYKRDSGELKSWWWVKRDNFVVSFGMIQGYEIFKEFYYKRFLDQNTYKILVLKRIPKSTL